jgi:predicted RNA-binding protein with PUA-like domain
MRYWLMKSEPDAYSVDDLARDGTTAWSGVRNYQARNFMRDQMQLGDPVFFYHSNCDEPGIVGIAEVSKLAYPDASQFDRKSDYYDPESSRADPRWLNVDIRFVKKIGPVNLAELRKHEQLAGMRILQRGNRLSVTPVDPAEWKFVLRLAEKSIR